MKKWTLLLVLSLCSVASAGEVADWYFKTYGQKPPTPQSPAKAQDTGITEIGLERAPCYGPCPIYSVVIKRDGSFRYKGERYVQRLGQYTGKLGAGSFYQLAGFIKDSGYFNLASSYAVPVTDMPTTYTTVVQNGKRKVISNYGDAGPAKLWAVEQLIDKLVNEGQWDKKAAAANPPQSHEIDGTQL